MAKRKYNKNAPHACHIVVTRLTASTQLVGVGKSKAHGRGVYRAARIVKGGRAKAKAVGEKLARKQGCKSGTGVVR